jgi:VCBS repeat-containing protein
LNSNGGFTFDANNAAYNSLAAGATQAVVANYSVADGRGGTATSTLTITVTGTNDAPVAVADTGPASTEGGAAVTGSVATNDSDPDTGAVLTYALNAPVAGLTLNTNGTYSFNPANAAYNSLAAGQTQNVVANYTVTDAQGLSSTSTLTFVVTGTNDAPVAVADVAAGTEGNGSLTGSVATNDSDPDQNAVLTYTLNAPVAGLTLNANGTYSFDLNSAAYDALAAGQTQVVVANYTVTDAQGATSTSTLTITVTGTNEGIRAVADTAAATEGGAVVTGSLATNDTNDEPGAVTYALNAPVAGLTVNTNGTFSFDPTNAAYNSIAPGETRAVVANYTATDAAGRTSTSTLTITVTGTNDVPVAVADTNAGAEDTTITGSVATNDSDPDAGSTLTYTVVGAAPAGFTLNANGTYTLDTRNAAYQNLTAGQVQNVVVNYQVADAQGGVATSTLTIAVTGVVETVNLDTDDDNNLATARLFEAGATDFAFSDDDNVASNVSINAFGADDIITFGGALSDYTFASGDFDADGAADDVRISSNVGGAAGTVVLTNSIAAGTTVTNEAQAEAAIGSGTDNFLFTGVVTPPGNTTASLDADDDNNILTARVFDASTDGFRFTDDADTANTAVITGFGTNDLIVLETGNSYSFSSTALQSDGDNITNDLVVTFNKNGVVSQIFIKDAVNPNSVIFDEAGAEQALNQFLGTSNVDYFQFA